MNATLKRLAEEALQLVPAERAELADFLVASLDASEPDEISFFGSKKPRSAWLRFAPAKSQPFRATRSSPKRAPWSIAARVRVEFHSEARAEYLAAAAYYEERQTGLGARFTTEIEATLQRVADAPERWRKN